MLEEEFACKLPTKFNSLFHNILRVREREKKNLQLPNGKQPKYMLPFGHVIYTLKPNGFFV